MSAHKGAHAGKAKAPAWQRVVILVAVLVIVASVGIIGLVVTGGLGSGSTSAVGNADQGQNVTENATVGEDVANQNEANPADATENANAADDAPNDQVADQN